MPPVRCSFVLFFFFFLFFFFAHFHFPASGQAVETGVIPSPPRFLPSILIAHRVQQSHCSSIVHRVLLTHALALCASHFVHKKKSQRIYTSMHSAGLELTKLTYTRLEDNLIRHRGDRHTQGLGLGLGLGLVLLVVVDAAWMLDVSAAPKNPKPVLFLPFRTPKPLSLSPSIYFRFCCSNAFFSKLEPHVHRTAYISSHWY